MLWVKDMEVCVARTACFSDCLRGIGSEMSRCCVGHSVRFPPSVPWFPGFPTSVPLVSRFGYSEYQRPVKGQIMESHSALRIPSSSSFLKGSSSPPVASRLGASVKLPPSAFLDPSDYCGGLPPAPQPLAASCDVADDSLLAPHRPTCRRPWRGTPIQHAHSMSHTSRVSPAPSCEGKPANAPDSHALPADQPLATRGTRSGPPLRPSPRSILGSACLPGAPQSPKDQAGVPPWPIPDQPLAAACQELPARRCACGRNCYACTRVMPALHRCNVSREVKFSAP